MRKKAPPAAPPAKEAPDWLPTAVLAATFLAFLPALWNNLIDWDDGVFIARNVHIRGLGLDNLIWMLTARMSGNYHPLTWLTLALDYAVWGGSPFGFHLTNVVLHALNAALFFYVAKRLLTAAQPQLEPARAALAAAFAALLFGLHPLRVESVAWATERRDVLSGLFYLLAVLAYLKEQRPRSLFYFTLSLLSKAVGVTLPLALLILDWYPLKRFSRERVVEKWPYFALAAAAALANAFTQSYNGALAPTSAYGLPTRLAAAAYGLCFYARKTLWPSHLIPIYEFPANLQPLEPRFLLSGVLVLAAAAALWALRKKRPALWAAALFYGLTLLPMLGLVKFGPQLVADRYSYLSCLPLALLAAAGAERLARRAQPETMALGGVLLVALTALTWRQCAVWHDTDGFFAYVLAEAPDTAIARHNVGRRLEARGRLDEAASEYRRAIAINPDYALAHNSLGLLLARRGDQKDAEPELREAIRLKPDYWEAHANLALTLTDAGRFPEALDEMNQAIALNPDLPALRQNLGLIEAAQARAQAKTARR